MKFSEGYPIGSPGIPWGDNEKAAWLRKQRKRRSYTQDVVSRIDALRAHYDVEVYGVLPYSEQVGTDYELFAVRSKNWLDSRPTILVTGGVHGYETSGVLGALAFLETVAAQYQAHFNVLVLPCISPWGYETINRWNPDAVDPNRSFTEDAPAQEAQLAMAYVAKHAPELLMHIDLHETTDTDNTEFRPALAARDGTVNTNWNIPDGFYLVGDTERPTPDFQKAILNSVKKVTHIAEADERNELIGVPVEQFGVIHYPGKQAGLCMGLSDAPYVSTTEVYPDSANATPQECIDAQVAAIVGGLNYLQR
ncbi:M14 family metallopeptidase [Aliidiomarina sanyensis]|nr:M14 family metallocarboxypeptidase [Aliidiomarina sanyensis]